MRDNCDYKKKYCNLKKELENSIIRNNTCDKINSIVSLNNKIFLSFSSIKNANLYYQNTGIYFIEIPDLTRNKYNNFQLINPELIKEIKNYKIKYLVAAPDDRDIVFDINSIYETCAQCHTSVRNKTTKSNKDPIISKFLNNTRDESKKIASYFFNCPYHYKQLQILFNEGFIKGVIIDNSSIKTFIKGQTKPFILEYSEKILIRFLSNIDTKPGYNINEEILIFSKENYNKIKEIINNSNIKIIERIKNIKTNKIISKEILYNNVNINCLFPINSNNSSNILEEFDDLEDINNVNDIFNVHIFKDTIDNIIIAILI